MVIENKHVCFVTYTSHTDTDADTDLGLGLMNGSLQFSFDIADHLQHIRILTKSTLKHHTRRIATDSKSADHLRQVCSLLWVGHVCS